MPDGSEIVGIISVQTLSKWVKFNSLFTGEYQEDLRKANASLLMPPKHLVPFLSWVKCSNTT